MKMIVIPASRIFSAISFGVFWRSAPSTRAIIRSRKVKPCAAVIRTLSQSEMTSVPPVTAERSPPASRMTGADSPVMAASLTEAMPSITSPSEGMRSPASTSTTCPGASLLAWVGTKSPCFSSTMSLAIVSSRVWRNVAACALPRPSAIASAKLANSTVNHSQTMIWKVKPRCSPPPNHSRMKMTVVSAATASTTNITGFFIITRGSSLAKAEPIAGITILGSVNAVTGVCLRNFEVCIDATPLARSEQLPRHHGEVLDDRPECQRREEREAANDQDHPDQEAYEQAAIGRESAGRGGHDLLGHKRARHRHHWN